MAEKKKQTKKNAEEKAPKNGYKRLYRSSTDRMIAGICGGLAEYFSIDPTIVRILFVVSIFAGGAGFVAYLIGWIIIPESDADSGRISPRSKVPIFGIVIGVILVLWGLSILSRNWFWMPWWFENVFSWESLFSLILIIVGVVLVVHALRKDGVKDISLPKIERGKKTLTRSRSNKKLSGVCSGIGEYFTIDPTIIRIAWVVGTLVTNIIPGLIAYIIMAIIVPEAPEGREKTS